MTLEAPRPLLGAGVKMKKIMAYLNNFLGKKLFYIENLTKLPELTVPIFFTLYALNLASIMRPCTDNK
jgi:hypothetical protein